MSFLTTILKDAFKAFLKKLISAGLELAWPHVKAALKRGLMIMKNGLVKAIKTINAFIDELEVAVINFANGIRAKLQRISSNLRSFFWSPSIA